jgi:pilus assembly protein Flp/PilA
MLPTQFDCKMVNEVQMHAPPRSERSPTSRGNNVMPCVLPRRGASREDLHASLTTATIPSKTLRFGGEINFAATGRRIVCVAIQHGRVTTAGRIEVSNSHARKPKEPTMKTLVKRFLNDQSGATAIEYGLIAAGISVAIISVVKGVGGDLKTNFTSVQNGLK